MTPVICSAKRRDLFPSCNCNTVRRNRNTVVHEVTKHLAQAESSWTPPPLEGGYRSPRAVKHIVGVDEVDV